MQWTRVCGLALMSIVLTLFGAGVAFAETPAALEHPAVQEVLVMVDAGLSERVIFERVSNIGEFPDLNADTLAALAKRGVTEAILVRMIELEAEPAALEPLVALPAASPVAEPIATAAPSVVSKVGLAPGQAGIKVVVERAFKITFLEVEVNGGNAGTEGKLWEGEGMMGERLRRPRWVKTEMPFIAFEGPVAPGTNSVGVGFAISQVIMDDPDDEWGEYSHERYVSRGLRSSGVKIGEGKERDTEPVTCQVSAGEICEVTATLEKRSPTKLGGIPTLSVSYEVRVIPSS
ncbi:MAG: hypothetical protein GY906_37860 [bacterium]|nr:hypothetical protein [bacterium]